MLERSSLSNRHDEKLFAAASLGTNDNPTLGAHDALVHGHRRPASEK